jgi:hypothetical protein
MTLRLRAPTLAIDQGYSTLSLSLVSFNCRPKCFDSFFYGYPFDLKRKILCPSGRSCVNIFLMNPIKSSDSCQPPHAHHKPRHFIAHCQSQRHSAARFRIGSDRARNENITGLPGKIFSCQSENDGTEQ